MQGLLADVNCEGYFRLLTQLLLAESRRELWDALQLVALEFSDLDLDVSTSDRIVWLRCQTEQLVLITANRNARDDDSLQTVIQELNSAESLPVLTISNPRRLARDATYANDTADKLLEYLYDIDNYYGAGRLFVP